MQERLQKILAQAGVASRRASEELIRQGRVRVNGEVVTELGTKADPSVDEIRADGKLVRFAAKTYLVLYKPRGVVTTRSDPAGRPTVMSLVPRIRGLFPVGRLDVNTEGLLLFTNDGAFAQRVTHPSYEVPRVYHAKVRGTPDPDVLARLVRGVNVEGERMAVDAARLLEGGANAWLEITLHEGKNREVRRLLESAGHPVSKLRRVALGPLTLRGLKPGDARALSPAEVGRLLDPDSSRHRRIPSAPRGRRRAARQRPPTRRPRS